MIAYKIEKLVFCLLHALPNPANPKANAQHGPLGASKNHDAPRPKPRARPLKAYARQTPTARANHSAGVIRLANTSISPRAGTATLATKANTG